MMIFFVFIDSKLANPG